MRFQCGIVHLLRLLKTSAYPAAAFFMSLLALGTSSVLASYPLADDEIQTVETLVNVGENRINFKIIKGGSPTILLEAGGGMDSTEWSELAPLLARKTGATIVSYDRAGFGKSDLPEIPYDMKEEIDWLWRGLRQLELNEDLILVGHSYGGWLIRLTASEHPGAVRGMVFVDPFTTEFVDLLSVEYLDNHPMAGKLPFDTSRPEKLSKIQRALVRMVGKGLGPKVETMRRTSVPEGIPIRIITCGVQFLPKSEEQQAWRQAHEQMAASIEGAILIVAEESGHMIPWKQPDIIVEAVSEVVRLVK